jgi:HK97 family phage portal protein
MLGRLLTRSAPMEERENISLSQMARTYGLAMSSTYTPIPVTVQRALTHAASSACIDVLASSVAATPVDVVRQQGKARVPLDPTPGLIGTPSALVEQDVWFYQLVDSMMTDGNGFGMVVSVDAMKRPTQIELLDAAGISDRRLVDGVPQATVDGKKHQVYPYGDLWHVPGKFVRAGSPFAESPIHRAQATIGTALAAREFGGRFFGDGFHPGQRVYAEQDLTPEQAQAVKTAVMNASRGTREPAVFGSGIKVEDAPINENDSQFIPLMQFAIEEACRFWRVPPAMVYAATSGQNVTYANVTQADLHYLKHSLEWLFRRLERALSRLIVRPQVVRFNRNAFLRSDAVTRGEYLNLRLQNKTLTINEYRALEDEEPYIAPEFDLPGIPAVSPAPPSGGT